MTGTGLSAQSIDMNPKPASKATLAAQAATMAAAPKDDGSDLEFARRGFVATLKDPIIRDANGNAVVNLEAFSFVEGKAPTTANPNLWRHIMLQRWAERPSNEAG